jgi:hypothetical protein
MYFSGYQSAGGRLYVYSHIGPSCQRNMISNRKMQQKSSDRDFAHRKPILLQQILLTMPTKSLPLNQEALVQT